MGMAYEMRPFVFKEDLEVKFKEVKFKSDLPFIYKSSANPKVLYQLVPLAL